MWCFVGVDRQAMIVRDGVVTGVPRAVPFTASLPTITSIIVGVDRHAKQWLWGTEWSPGVTEYKG